MADKASARDPYGRLDATSERLRTNARWIAIAFGTVASVAFAGFAISDLGALDPEDETLRFAVAAGAAVVAVTALGLGISWVSRLGGVTVDMEELHDLGAVTYRTPSGKDVNAGLDGLITKDNGRTLGYDDIETLLVKYVEAQAAYAAKMHAYAEDPGSQLAQAELTAAYRNHALHNAAVSDAKAIAAAQRLKLTYDSARNAISFRLAISILAVIVFVWAANPPGEQTVQLFGPQPSEGTLAAAPAAADSIEAIVGPECDVERIPVVVLGTSDAGVDVITTGGGGCVGSIRLTVPPTVGTVTIDGTVTASSTTTTVKPEGDEDEPES